VGGIAWQLEQSVRVGTHTTEGAVDAVAVLDVYGLPREALVDMLYIPFASVQITLKSYDVFSVRPVTSIDWFVLADTALPKFVQMVGSVLSLYWYCAVALVFVSLFAESTGAFTTTDADVAAPVVTVPAPSPMYVVVFDTTCVAGCPPDMPSGSV
jgi:hypothetical protein